MCIDSRFMKQLNSFSKIDFLVFFPSYLNSDGFFRFSTNSLFFLLHVHYFVIEVLIVQIEIQIFLHSILTYHTNFFRRVFLDCFHFMDCMHLQDKIFAVILRAIQWDGRSFVNVKQLTRKVRIHVMLCYLVSIDIVATLFTRIYLIDLIF